mmetsp:Transcript_19532/g.35421  ORF Transcript_19532/g.35421 Transcript_19532/m.35421 type:complete len:279 (+) Transcript_19532:1652-2488(+)
MHIFRHIKVDILHSTTMMLHLFSSSGYKKQNGGTSFLGIKDSCFCRNSLFNASPNIRRIAHWNVDTRRNDKLLHESRCQLFSFFPRNKAQFFSDIAHVAHKIAFVLEEFKPETLRGSQIFDKSQMLGVLFLLGSISKQDVGPRFFLQGMHPPLLFLFRLCPHDEFKSSILDGKHVWILGIAQTSNGGSFQWHASYQSFSFLIVTIEHDLFNDKVTSFPSLEFQGTFADFALVQEGTAQAGKFSIRLFVPIAGNLKGIESSIGMFENIIFSFCNFPLFV